MNLRTAGVAAIALASLTGCASLRERPDLCRALAIGTGAALGGAAGGLTVAYGAHDPARDNKAQVGGAAAGGTLLGGLVGWGLSEALCKAEPPPPPPPPPAARPAPPPPVEPRRGG